jgi:LysR family transcriptional regulator, hydrogen peroxide-inducible genes activator
MIKLTIRQMEYFAALAETLHFGRAAQLAGVTQPALSAQIAEMEEKLGMRLFERGRRGVTLSDDAQILLPRIERVLGEMRDIEGLARRERAAMSGRLRLGVIPTVAPYLLPAILPALGQRFPDLSLELRESVTATLVEETLAGRLDAFIAALPLDEKRLGFEPMLDDDFVLAVPEHDPKFIEPPVAPESPELERLILLEEGHCLRDQALAICGSVKPVAMTNFGATSLTTLLQMVAHGQGLTLVPDMALPASRTLPGVKFVPFTDPVPSRLIGMAWRKRATRESEYRALAATIGELARGSRAPTTPT